MKHDDNDDNDITITVNLPLLYTCIIHDATTPA